MAEAKRSIQETTDRAQRMATMTLALQRARNAVKEELKRQRVRIADVEAKEITERARGYLSAHPELVAEARPVVESWFARGVFGKRAHRPVGDFVSEDQILIDLMINHRVHSLGLRLLSGCVIGSHPTPSAALR